MATKEKLFGAQEQLKCLEQIMYKFRGKSLHFSTKLFSTAKKLYRFNWWAKYYNTYIGKNGEWDWQYELRSVLSNIGAENLYIFYTSASNKK